MARGKALTREIVLNKAIELAKADGIDSVTYNRLARELDIRPQSMYRYVSNLKELQVFLINRFLSEFMEIIEESITGLTPIETLRMYAMKFYDGYHENPRYHEAFELMHRYDVIPEVAKPLTFLTDIIQKQMEQIETDPDLASRYTQLFMAINIGYTHMAITDFFSSRVKDDRQAFATSVNEFIDKIVLTGNLK